MNALVMIEESDLRLLVRAAEVGATLYPHERLTVGESTRVNFVLEELRNQR